MKKSEMYKLAQRAVLTAQAIPADDKLEVLRELMERRDLAELWEKERDEKEKADEAV